MHWRSLRPKRRKSPNSAVGLIEAEFDLQPVISDPVQARQ